MRLQALAMASSGVPPFMYLATRCMMTSLSMVVWKMVPWFSSSSRRLMVLTRLPLWARARFMPL